MNRLTDTLMMALISLLIGAQAEAGPLRIHTDFPGGNVLVLGQTENTVAIAPDLRGDNPWFYWYFEVQADRPGPVRFEFPAASRAQITPHGPAVSLDGGASWHWLGADSFTPFDLNPPDGAAPVGDAFVFTFDSAHQTVRFSTGVPYLQSHLDGFLQQHAGNPHLTRQVLTRSAQGREVEYLRIGTTSDGRQHLLFTARSHACEAMASYVLEGFMREAISDAPFAQAFRDRYFLHVVPFLDKDGVEAGDQGKNRKPHDHNRDYGPDSIYPEIRAVKALADREPIRFAIDFHCPTLRMDIHQGFYWAGVRLPHIERNLQAYSGWLAEEQPPIISGRGPRIDLRPPLPDMPLDRFSRYFAYRDGMKLAVTFEVPYVGNIPLDAEMARHYGAAMLRAWVRTGFTAPDTEPPSPREYAAFSAFRKSFLDVYMRDPDGAAAIAAPYLQDEDADLLYRIEAHNLMGTMRQRQGRLAEARQFFQFALDSETATSRQQAEALTQCVRIAGDPRNTESSIADVRQAIRAFESFSYPALRQQEEAYGSVSAFFKREGEYASALEYARRQLSVARPFFKGSVLNDMAALHDLMQQPEQAVARRREAVSVLRGALDPVPVGIFGPMMAADLLDALNGIPDVTVAEKQAAADIAFNHPVRPAHLIQRVRQALGEE